MDVMLYFGVNWNGSEKKRDFVLGWRFCEKWEIETISEDKFTIYRDIIFIDIYGWIISWYDYVMVLLKRV